MRKLIASFSALLAITCAVMFVCNRPGHAADPTSDELLAPNVETAEIHGFDPANMDKSASACTNFFQYADGGWVEHNPVPPAYARWGKFEELAQKNQMVLRDILEAAAKNKKAKPNSLEQKVGTSTPVVWMRRRLKPPESSRSSLSFNGLVQSKT